jgi:hypothetical protein
LDKHAKPAMQAPVLPRLTIYRWRSPRSSSVINLRTAKMLGLAMPATMLAGAKEIIEWQMPVIGPQ